MADKEEELFKILDVIKYGNYAIVPDDTNTSKIEDLVEMMKYCGELRLDNLVEDGIIPLQTDEDGKIIPISIHQHNL